MFKMGDVFLRLKFTIVLPINIKGCGPSSEGKCVVLTIIPEKQHQIHSFILQNDIEDLSLYTDLVFWTWQNAINRWLLHFMTDSRPYKIIVAQISCKKTNALLGLVPCRVTGDKFFRTQNVLL